MLYQLETVLDPQQLATAKALLHAKGFNDGRRSAGQQAGRGKRNLEYSAPAGQSEPVNNLVMGALIRHPVYLNAGLPKKIASPFYSLYKEGMGYDKHVDNPVMGIGDQYRSDLAITLFLSAPEEYDGGELEIEMPYGTQLIKGVAGDGVMYPASTRHRVKTVTAGERLVAVTWMQSLVPEAEKRMLLYDLYLARQALLHTDPDNETTHRVDHSYVNLVRMWSQL
jgi:PKHD-type hydroxylase